MIGNGKFNFPYDLCVALYEQLKRLEHNGMIWVRPDTKPPINPLALTQIAQMVISGLRNRFACSHEIIETMSRPEFDEFICAIPALLETIKTAQEAAAQTPSPSSMEEASCLKILAQK